MKLSSKEQLRCDSRKTCTYENKSEELKQQVKSQQNVAEYVNSYSDAHRAGLYIQIMLTTLT
jgi:hypothetical protein